MSGYIVRRLISMVPVAFIVTVALFILVRSIPGDPVRVILGEQITPQTYQAKRHELGLDQSYPVQYAKWINRVAHLDFGRSLSSGDSVSKRIKDRLPATLELQLVSLSIGVLAALALGVSAAVWRDSIFAKSATAFSLLFVSVPGFLLGTLEILFFAVHWRLFPPGGYIAFSQNPSRNIHYLILPALVGALFQAAYLSRFIRSSLLETLYNDCIRTARAKGLTQRVIVFRHALRNALLPVVTLVGLTIGALWEGAVITETVFSWPGIGQLSINSFGSRDYPIIEAIVLIGSITFMFTNLAVDIIYAYLDPRISYGRG
jgi:peptide/nickel transport system permease protein